MPDEDVAEIEGNFTFGDAPVMRLVAVDKIVEPIGTIRSSSITLFDLFCDVSTGALCDGRFEALCSNSFRSFSF